jgi:osmoprotectant transport system substrate-binding protein
MAARLVQSRLRALSSTALVLLVVAVVGCQPDGGSERLRVVIGVGSTTEQRVLAALALEALDDAGMAPELQTDLGGTVGLRREALGGSIDVFWDYTGAAWALGMGQQAPPSDPKESYERVRRADEDNGLAWLAPSTANATLALFVRRQDLPAADRPRGLAWLAGVLSSGEGTLCADSEFITRSGGLEALAVAYAIDVERLTEAAVPANEAEAIAAVASRRCFAALATATSGEARRAGLMPVADDLLVFPAFIVAPVARADRLPALPGLATALERISTRLTSEQLATMNAAAEGGRDPAEIAEDFFRDEQG